MSAHFPRRTFIGKIVVGSFALAVQPVQAQSVIKTNDNGLTTGQAKIPAGDIELPVYFARPAKTKNAPIILVIQEIFGVHEWVQDICRRLAQQGYFAVAPALYTRQGDPAREPSIEAIQQNIVSKVPDEQVMRDIDRTAAWASQNGGDTQRIAITGFCWGGRITWLYAAERPTLKAAVAWYGKVVGAPSAMTPQHPVDRVAQLKVPVLGLYAGQDNSIPAESLDKMRAALKESSKAHTEIVVYPEAQHGFMADYRPSYNPQAAKDAWQKMLAWLKQNGM